MRWAYTLLYGLNVFMVSTAGSKKGKGRDKPYCQGVHVTLNGRDGIKGNISLWEK
jgi:hypothetical protein